MAEIKPTVILTAAIGGILIAHETAKKYKARCIFAEKKNGELRLRRGFKIESDDKVLIVDDFVKTGNTVNILKNIVIENKAELVGMEIGVKLE